LNYKLYGNYAKKNCCSLTKSEEVGGGNEGRGSSNSKRSSTVRVDDKLVVAVEDFTSVDSLDSSVVTLLLVNLSSVLSSSSSPESSQLVSLILRKRFDVGNNIPVNSFSARGRG
jgi:hypothetical protein